LANARTEWKAKRYKDQKAKRERRKKKKKADLTGI
jgi:hypothetical protein